ncbi:GNAT family N-acetyltransferase [Paracoccus spongiarum]|uniref:GNAT family N-acetyltransferase n=1 Tax=Paracoccus spongiarum TaxID=3064387 RepID=A0ABT9J7W4_9RHOB|nr:GNAT family N-acetyltransferase [Paracoccus sp. 2205BS29-5]MDP5305901.1 GNAT family N-acetyltransferase [Paracoccus sp. 2205BS29-5]
MRKPRQEPPPRIIWPIPDTVLLAASGLWWQAFRPPLALRLPACRAGHGIVALDACDRVLGVVGLRDGEGGFPVVTPLAARLAFRAAPATDDLVIDGIVVSAAGRGIGRALMAAAQDRAAQGGHPGLRVEVGARNRAARDFYRRIGFVEIGRGRFGWPLSPPVVLMRRGPGAG